MPKAKVVKEPEIKVKKSSIVLNNTAGEEVSPVDYFFSDGSEEEAKKGFIPTYFNKVCGHPVIREDLVAVFDKIFKPADGFLLYKVDDKEVYLVIVPLKFSNVGVSNGSISGDFQKHGMSFIFEGSASVDSFKNKLKNVAKFIRKAQDE